MAYRLYFLIVLLAFFFVTTIAEGMLVKKITLARFKEKGGNIVNQSKSLPDWSQVDRHLLTIDDAGKIYILNLWNNEILIYSAKGRFQKSIRLGIKLRRQQFMNGDIEVSGDGKTFFVNGYDQSLQVVQLIFNRDGKVISDFSKVADIAPFPDKRLCNNTYLVLMGSYVYDQQFNILNEKFSGFSDAEGKYRSYKGLLTKTSSSGKKLWEKQFYGNFAIIGIDASNYIYVEGGLRKGDPNSLYKLDSKGNILEQAPIPTPFPFKTQAEKDEWEMHASEEFLSFFKVACNGDVYLIYQLGELPEATFKRWLKGGEYFIYKFESTTSQKEAK